MTKSSCLQCRLISSSNVVPSTDDNDVAASIGRANKEYWDHTSSQNAIIILIMCGVILIIIFYCLWGTARRRYIFRRQLCPCFMSDDMTISSGSVTPRTYSSTGQVNTGRSYRGAPTIILLPQGRMLVVDGSVIAQFRADTQGVDLMELGQSIAWQRHQSTPSILSSTDSKDGISPIMPMTRFSPPSYESLFGTHMMCNDGLVYDLPPSYSEINFQLQQLNNALSREFSNLSIRTMGRHRHPPQDQEYHQTQRHPHTTSDTDLPRIQLVENRRYRSADLLENQEYTNYSSLVNPPAMPAKTSSEGDVLCSENSTYISAQSSNLANTTDPLTNVLCNAGVESIQDLSQSLEPIAGIEELTARINIECETGEVESSSARAVVSQTCTIQNKPFDENIRESRV